MTHEQSSAMKKLTFLFFGVSFVWFILPSLGHAFLIGAAVAMTMTSAHELELAWLAVTEAAQICSQKTTEKIKKLTS